MTDPGGPARPSRLAALARAVRERRVSAEELVADALGRIEAARSLGAIVAIRPEGALAEARAWTSGSFSGRPVGRMAGLPLLVKDLEAAAGLATTFGSLPWADARPAERDGVAASRLREADAILLGKTNTPEFALSGHTSNRLFGPTRNPCQPASALEGLRTKKSRPLGIDRSRS